jgi:type IV pilus assembly protein PilN
MIRINLLPHREEKRQAQKRQMGVIAGGIAILGVLSVLLGYTIIAGIIEYQKGNNEYLKGEIGKLDKEIAEIKALKDKTQSLLARKKVVEDLQTDRSSSVHLLDQLVRQLPEGIYLKAIKQNGKSVTIQGYAQSNARVSTLMRNLEESPWLESPNLVEVKAVTVNNLRANEFTLTVKLSAPQQAVPASPATSKDKKS